MHCQHTDVFTVGSIGKQLKSFEIHSKLGILQLTRIIIKYAQLIIKNLTDLTDGTSRSSPNTNMFL